MALFKAPICIPHRMMIMSSEIWKKMTLFRVLDRKWEVRNQPFF
jgi:hypothetical protein